MKYTRGLGLESTVKVELNASLSLRCKMIEAMRLHLHGHRWSRVLTLVIISLIRRPWPPLQAPWFFSFALVMMFAMLSDLQGPRVAGMLNTCDGRLSRVASQQHSFNGIDNCLDRVCEGLRSPP